MATNDLGKDPFGDVIEPTATTDPFGDVVPATAVAPVADPFGEVIGKPATTSGLSKEQGGWVVPSLVKEQDVAAIAKQHGVSKEDLDRLVPIYGGLTENTNAADIPSLAAGFVGETVGAGIPQWAHKKLQNPAMQAAIDELADLVEQNKSTAQKGVELVGSIGSSIGAAKGVAKLAGKAAPAVYNILAPIAGGAAAGLSHSKSGEELEGAALGGTIGAVIPAVATGVGKLSRRVGPVREAMTKPLGAAGAVALFLSDAAPSFDIIDRQLGNTSLGKTLTESSVKNNQLNNAFGEILKNTNKAATMDDVAKFVQESNKVMTNLGYDQIKPTNLKAIDSAKQAFLDKYKASPTNAEFVNSLRQYTGQPIANRADIDKAMQAVLIDDGTLWRKAADSPTPAPWLVETNPVNIASSFAAKAERNAIQKDLIPEVDRARQLARERDDYVVSNYLERYKRDLLGGKKTISDSIKESAMSEWDRLVTKKVKDSNGIDKGLWRAKAETPAAIMNLMQNSVYHNGIGLNLSSAIQNLVSPYTMAISELGPDKATKYAVEAMGDLAKVVRDGMEIKASPALAAKLGVKAGDTVTTRNPAIVAMNEGLMGTHWRGELTDPLIAQAKKNQLASALNSWTKNYGNIVMGPFQWSENQGRGVVAFMGRRMAKDLQKDPSLIEGMIKSPSYRREISNLIKQGAPEDVLNTQVVNYLNSHTLLNFDKLNMSEYGRFVGPLLRQYTKIPTYVAGRVAQSVHDKGFVNGMVEGTGAYLAPLTAYYLVDQLLDTKDNPRLRKVIGSDGFQNWSVGKSAFSAIDTKGGFMRSPLVQAVEGLGKGGQKAMEGDVAGGLAKAADVLYNTVGPGAGVLRLLGEDAPALLENKEPDRSEPLKTKRRLQEILGK